MRYSMAIALVATLAFASFAEPAAAGSLRIVFASESAPGNLDLFTITPAGDGRQKITAGPADDEFPSLSPARDQIVFARTKPNGKRSLFMVTPSGGFLHAVPNTAGGGAPSWSPDGQRIAFASAAGGILTVDPAGQLPEQLTETDGDATPEWSPDSSHIVFARNGQLWTMKANGSQLKKLANKGQDPAWAPNGKHIAFARKGKGLFAMDANGKNVVQLTTKGERPAWEPNSRHVAFATSAGAGSKIRTVLFGGAKPHNTLVTPGVTPAW